MCALEVLLMLQSEHLRQLCLNQFLLLVSLLVLHLIPILLVPLRLLHRSMPLLFGFNEVTIRKWIFEFERSDFAFNRSLRGLQPKVQWGLNDLKLEVKAAAWLDSQCKDKKGYLTPERFCVWVNQNLFPDTPISKETARRWMHKLGFHPVVYSKGIYKDGHERIDVVEARVKYLQSKREQDPHLLHRRPTIQDLPFSGTKVIEIVHDECICHANDDVRIRWSRPGEQVLKPKGRGKGIMISMFLTEVEGILRDEDGKPCVEYLEYGKNFEGYWDSDLMADHLRRAIKAAKARFPYAQIVFRFDNSSNHLAYAEDALVANRMSAKPGGKQPVMHDTIWQGKRQSMVFEEGKFAGKPKGLKQILMERGVNIKGFTMKHKDPKKNYRKVMATHPDFQSEPTLLAKMVIDAGYLCYFYPRFHPELSPIELFWAALKEYLRKHCGYDIKSLRENIPKALETICEETIRRFFGKCRRYEAMYCWRLIARTWRK